MVHAQRSRDFSQALPTGREESAEQAVGLEFLEPGLPAIGAAAHSLKDPRQLGRNRGFALAEEPAGVVDQEQVVSQ